MERLLFVLEENETMGTSLLPAIGASQGKFILRRFPDEETYVRILSDVERRDCIVLSCLQKPDHKFLSLYFLSKTLRELGAGKITLVCPYLPYMRQDKRFNPGEAITSKYFAELLSSISDEVITIDPHLHRTNALSDIYSVSTKVLHASPIISEYIKKNIPKALLIGPDSESEQWVSEVAEKAGAPFVVLEKNRTGDKEVQIIATGLENYKNFTPVLVDDIISSGRTMIETIRHTNEAGMKAPVCIGIHAVFSKNAYEDLLQSGVSDVVTTNTIQHASNKIDVSELIIKSLSAGEKQY